MAKTIFWDVDTQYDFMMRDGKLYVQGAEGIARNLKALTEFARENDIQICGSVDYHLPTDEELSDHPDLHETFPPHCLQGTPGQKKIPETNPIDPLWVDSDVFDEKRLEKAISKHGGEILFRKQKFDVFSNPNVPAVLDILKPTDIVVYGVALDVCDAHAIEGFLRIGKYNIYLVTDAAKAIYEDKGRELVEDWGKRGVRMVNTTGVVSGELPGNAEKAV